jgi:hypothetical protein
MEQKLMNVHTHRSFYLQVPGYILPKLDLRVTAWGLLAEIGLNMSRKTSR